MVQICKDLSLELMSFDVAPQQDLYTKQGVAVTVEAVAQIKVKSDPESIRTAAEQFLTKAPDERGLTSAGIAGDEAQPSRSLPRLLEPALESGQLPAPFEQLHPGIVAGSAMARSGGSGRI